jgi:hypothetical protein
MLHLARLCAALIVCAAPAAAETLPPVPFLTAYTYWDHHWLQWLPSHSRFEAIEASVASPRDGESFIRVWLTERAPPKRQVFYFDDRDRAAAMRTGESHFAAIDYRILGVAGAPRGIELGFRDAEGERVNWRVGFAPDATLETTHAGLKPQGGHSADEVFLLFVLGPNATTYDAVAMIGDRVYAVTPETARTNGRYYGAAYTAGAHNAVFAYGTRPIGAVPAAVEMRRDAAGSLTSYTHRFGTHDLTVRVESGRYVVAFDSGAPVLTGTVTVAEGVQIWRPDSPGWAREVVLRSEIRDGMLAISRLR